MVGDTSNLILEFEDGEVARFDVRQHETVYAAARRAGVTMASNCRQGQCKTCMCSSRQGALIYPDQLKTTLTEAERQAGYVLPCVGSLNGDARLYAPYKRSAMLPTKSKAVDILNIDQLSESVVRLRCKLGPMAKIDFLPGQYMHVAVPGSAHIRYYSMATAQKDWPVLDFLIRILPDGVMSSFLRQARAGDKITLVGPFGTFYLRENAGPILMVAGGTGLAPFLSMLATLRHRGQFDRRVTLCFGVNSLEELFYAAEIEAYRTHFPSIDIRIAIMRPSADWSGAQGTAVDLVTATDARALDEDGAAYLCGPPAMIDASRRLLLSLGVDQNKVYAEEFVPSGA
jgi:benzoate/toluate 1,2-dioxygenase reductase subunit